MSNQFNSELEEKAFEAGKDEGYEECMKEWLGMLRFHLASVEMRIDSGVQNGDFESNALLEQSLRAKKEYIESIIKLRWHTELDEKTEVAHGA